MRKAVELVHEDLPEALPAANEQHEHEDAPEHAKTGKDAPAAVAQDAVQNFPEGI